jgi:hypothetical protein
MATLQQLRVGVWKLKGRLKDYEAAVLKAEADPDTVLELICIARSTEAAVALFPDCEDCECDEGCMEHTEACDGFCDHVAGHVNMCMTEE